MNHIKSLSCLLSIVLSLVVFSCHNNKLTSSATNELDCTSKDGYWYNGKCWADFDDQGISKEDIDRVVEEEMVNIKRSQVNINDKTHTLTFFFPEMDKNEVTFIAMYKDKNGTNTLLQTVATKELKNASKTSKPTAMAILLKGNVMTASENEAAMIEMMSNPIAVGDMKVTVNDFDNLDMTFKGELLSVSDEKYNVSFTSSESIVGAGASEMIVKGTEVHINGELGTKSYHQLKEIIQNHPEVKTAVLGKINGSVNDAVNMHTGRILREAGLNTKVLSDSEIASGGVDLFCAGKERIVEQGAKIGIHSWCCLGDLTAVEVPRDHPAHQYQIEFFTMCMGKEKGPDFYFHTLTAAPFDGIHWMSDEDIEKWKVATEFIEK